MPGPGEYRPDPTEGITRIDDLPKPKVASGAEIIAAGPARAAATAPTATDGPPHPPRPRQPPHRPAPRHRRALLPALLLRVPQVLQRRHDRPGRPRQPLHPPRHRHRRPPGRRGRPALSRRQLDPLARPPRLRPLRHDPELGRGRGEKGGAADPTEHLDWALSDFSGYIAADELYDGPFCILSIVDNRTLQAARLPGPRATTRRHRTSRRSSAASSAALEARGLTVKGITTDGSALYPEPIATVFGDVPHQVCTFHVLREVTKAVLSAVAKERKRLAADAPKLPRGRPGTKAARRAARRKKRIERKVGDLFEHRYLFVRRQLTASERATLRRITRGLPQLRTLRGLMEEVYRLFDRRCRTATALAKLAALAGPVAAVRPAPRGAEEAAVAGAGEGAGVPGRAAAGCDVERGGAGEPPVPQDAEDGVLTRQGR